MTDPTTRPEQNVSLDAMTAVERERLLSALSYMVFFSYVAVLALLVASAYYLLPLPPAVEQTLYLLDTIFAVVLLFDFLLRLAYSTDRKHYLLHWGWFDLLTSMPGLPFLRILRAGRLIHNRRSLLAVAPRELLEEARSRLAESTLLVVAAAALLMLTVGTIAIAFVEAPNPDASIETGGDAIWWALVTIATVGYGDMVPITPAGRLVGGFMIVVGVAVYTVLTSTLASGFVSNADKSRRAREAALPGGPDGDGAGDSAGTPLTVHGRAPDDSEAAQIRASLQAQGETMVAILDRLAALEAKLDAAGGAETAVSQDED